MTFEKWWETEERKMMVGLSIIHAQIIWQAAQPQWQPIETVPRDKNVLLLDEDGDMVVGVIYALTGWCSHGGFDPVKWQPLPKLE